MTVILLASIVNLGQEESVQNFRPVVLASNGVRQSERGDRHTGNERFCCILPGLAISLSLDDVDGGSRSCATEGMNYQARILAST